MTTLHCIWSDDCNWASWATDLGRYSYFSGKLRHKFTRLSEKTIMLAKKYNPEDIFMEKEPNEMMDSYLGTPGKAMT